MKIRGGFQEKASCGWQRDRPERQEYPHVLKAHIPGALSPSAPAGLEKSHLLLLAQNHLHPVHGHDDAHFLLLNVLGFEFVLMGRKTQVTGETVLGGTWDGAWS